MRRAGLLLTLLILLAGAYVRKPDAFWLPQLWAEDGSVFFRDAHELGIASLGARYAGYYHLAPRLIAWVGDLLIPTATIPRWYNFCALLGLLFLGVKLASPRFGALAPPPLLALAVVFAPVYNEPFVNLTNLQWVLALYLVVYLAGKPAVTLCERMSDLADITIVGMSGLFIAFFLPLFWMRAWIHRHTFRNRRFERCTLLLAHIIAGIQIAGMESARTPGDSGLWHFDSVRVFARMLALPIFGPGGDSLPEHFAELSILLSTSLLLIYFGLTVYCVRQRLWPAFVTLWAGIFVWIAVFISIRHNPGIIIGGGERYFFLQGVTLTWTLCVLLPRLRIFAGGALSLLLLSFLLYAPEYRSPSLPNLRWKRASKCVGVSYPCAIPINPSGWGVYLSDPRFPSKTSNDDRSAAGLTPEP